MKKEDNIYPVLARQAILSFLNTRKVMSLPDRVPDEVKKKKAGVFVSLHKKNGELRGCIGTFLPTKENIGLEVIENAINAGFKDPRFFPLIIEEIDGLEISVDVLEKPEKIGSNLSGEEIGKVTRRLDEQKYGVIISTKNGKRGLLLPDIEGVDSVEKQIEIAREKAGIEDREKIDIERFKVERFKE